MARVMTRQGLLGKSFAQAAEGVSDATGCNVSKESVRLVTQKWGDCVEKQRKDEVEAIFDTTIDYQPATTHCVGEQATVSTDGGMIHVRGEGWKEVKLSVVSSVRPKKASERSNGVGNRRYAPYEPEPMITNHSYQAGLWQADDAGQHLYREALRRQLAKAKKTSAVADGAHWISRITGENFPDMVQILDWFHLCEKLQFIARAYYPNPDERNSWVDKQLDFLWMGKTDPVIEAIDKFPLPDNDETLVSALGYVKNQQAKMAYHQYRVAGYPIGSGCVESGINTVVHHRMKTQGRGWCRKNGQAMLAALSELHSGTFSQTWASVQ